MRTGLVGGQLVLDLLAIGTPPEAIRIIDAQEPARKKEFSTGAAARVAFVQTNITNEAATIKAYSLPWPEVVSRLPLTVLHTAAVIRPFERREVFYHRSSSVNVGGVANSLAAARKVGASIFILTSSSTAECESVDWFFWPWGRGQPRNFVQLLSGKDFGKPLKPLEKSQSAYARSKAEAERLICGADNVTGMRTGVIRPGNTIYGHRKDTMISRMLALRMIPTWVAGNVHNCINVRNVSLAHFKLEEVLLSEHADKVAARPFLVTDDGPPMRFNDSYRILDVTSITGFKVFNVPPLLILLVSYLIETYCMLLAQVPLLRSWMSEPTDPLILFQPSTFASSLNVIVDDSDARRAPEFGGLGYRPMCTTLEGLCEQVLEWNESEEAQLLAAG